MDNIFGGKRKTPTLVQQAQPPDKIVQSADTQREALMKKLAKRKRATVLSQNLGQANVRKQRLGAGV